MTMRPTLKFVGRGLGLGVLKTPFKYKLLTKLNVVHRGRVRALIV